MIHLNKKLPDALILPEKIHDLRAHLSGQGAHWFSARTAHAAQGDNPCRHVSALDSLTSKTVAHKTKPNKGHSQFEDKNAQSGVVFQQGKHCGFKVENIQLEPQDWSCAIRFRAAQNSARTLITVNPEDSKNYVFVQQVRGEVIFKDKQATLELTAPLDATHTAATVIVGQSNDRLWLRATDGAVHCSDRAAIALDAPRALFIGCRSNKARLLKTLGQFTLFDLVFWPTINILDAQQHSTLDALGDDTVWRENS